MTVDIPLSIPLQIIAYFREMSLFSSILSAVAVVGFSMVFVFSSEKAHSYPKRRLSALYNSFTQSDDNFETEGKLTLPELVLKFQQIEKMREKLTEIQNEKLKQSSSDQNIPENPSTSSSSSQNILRNSPGHSSECSAEHSAGQNVLLENSSWCMLKLISTHLKKNPNELKEAAQFDLHYLAVDYVLKMLPTAEHNKILVTIDITISLPQSPVALTTISDGTKISVAIDITNSLLQNPIAFSSISEETDRCTLFVETILTIIKIYLMVNVEGDEDMEINEVDVSMSDYFNENGYKFILALGLILSENLDLNSISAEKGSIVTVLECMKLRKSSSSIAKWCLWALMNICFDHPPNKSIFIYKNGLSIVITTIRHHSLNSDVNKQGLSLLFYILTDSIQSKFHLKDARKAALSLGIITVIETAQINFKEESTIQDPCNYLLQILATEFD